MAAIEYVGIVARTVVTPCTVWVGVDNTTAISWLRRGWSKREELRGCIFCIRTFRRAVQDAGWEFQVRAVRSVDQAADDASRRVYTWDEECASRCRHILQTQIELWKGRWSMEKRLRDQ